MKSFVKTYPQMLGIGIDEATAIVVTGSTAEVTGRGKVHFYDASRAEPDVLPTGGRFDLKARKVLK
jgi:cyanophycinase-like exopeptidase